jgi:hypothetical protein
VTAFELDQTVFGMTFVGVAMALEEVTLVVTPVREERRSIAVGNIGLLAVTRSFTLDASVLTFYVAYWLVSYYLV